MLVSYFKNSLWTLVEGSLKPTLNLINQASSLIKTQPSNLNLIPQETTQTYEINQPEITEIEQPTTTYYEEKREVPITSYKEEKKEIVMIKKKETETEKQEIINQEKKDELPDQKEKEKEKETIKQENPNNLTENEEIKPIVIGGSNLSPRDPCDDYKTKNYPQIIINEIQFETATDTKDEFIELYNPNSEEVNLTCWTLEKYASKQNPTSTPTLTKLIPESKFEGIIKPKSFFLITSSSTKEKYQGDLAYPESYSISKNNVIILKKPNGEISDLVGYGDKEEKIYQSENQPFISQNFENKSIQRKNFLDTNNNSKDFWLRKPTPQNSSITQSPREDFLDLEELTIENFSATSSLTEEGTIFVNLSFQEPFSTVSSTNYVYDLIISTSTLTDEDIDEVNPFKLEDFGASTTLPSPKFDSSTTTVSFEIKKCPTENNLYYLGLFLKDLLDDENKTKLATTSIELPQDFCFLEETTSTTSTATTTGKILFSEIRVLTSTSTGEYIELYNPNEYPIDLTNWRIERNTKGDKTGSFYKIVPASKFKNIIIQPFSYLLLLNSNTPTSTFPSSPDIFYAKSPQYNLAEDDALILYDSENNIIDEFSWKEVDNEKSFQRKKTASSTENTLVNEELNLGNAYDTDNNSDFLLANPYPENSSITKPTMKEIKDFKAEIEGSLYHFSWFSPALYDQNLKYELRYSTSSETNFENATPINITLPEFHLLSNQKASLDYCRLGLKTKTITFHLGILKENQLINSTKITKEAIDCFDISHNFKAGSYSTFSGDYREFEVLKNVNLEEIYVLNLNQCPGVCRAYSKFTSLTTKITQLISTTTEIQITTTTYITVTTTLETTDESGATTTIEISTTTPTTTVITTTTPTTTEITLMTTSTFAEIEWGCFRMYGGGMDDHCNGPQDQLINDFYYLYQVPINLSLNQGDIIRIYVNYEETSGFDDGWWIHKFLGKQE